MICSLSGRQVKYLKFSAEDACISIQEWVKNYDGYR